jgi:hypothetical protein
MIVKKYHEVERSEVTTEGAHLKIPGIPPLNSSVPYRTRKRNNREKHEKKNGYSSFLYLR